MIGHSGVPTDGEMVLAQLRSQSGQFALSWQDLSIQPLETVHMTTMTLLSLLIEPFRLSGDGCPFPSCTHARCDAVHAVGCKHQNLRSLSQAHTWAKRKAQQLLRRHYISTVCNEDVSMLTNGKRADTALYPGALQMCDDSSMQHVGFILDTTIRCPTTQRYLSVNRSNAANTAGYAAAVGERDKEYHHAGCFNRQRWRLVPLVQESYGRMGSQAVAFSKQLAAHSAACRGGTVSQIRLRRGRVYASIRTDFSTELARENAERLFAYVRGAQRFYGRTTQPVSSLLCADHSQPGGLDDRVEC